MAKATDLDVMKYFIAGISQDSVLVIFATLSSKQRSTVIKFLEEKGLNSLVDDLKLVEVESLINQYDNLPAEDKSDVLSCPCSHCYAKIDPSDDDSFRSHKEQEIVSKLLEIHKIEQTDEMFSSMIKAAGLEDDSFEDYELADFFDFEDED